MNAGRVSRPSGLLMKKRISALTVHAMKRGSPMRAADGAALPAGEHLPSLAASVLECLEDAKAEDVISIDLVGRTPMADWMIIATGRSDRHVGAIAGRVLDLLKDRGCKGVRTEGLKHCDWVLIDTGDIVIHVFRPEVRGFYNLEKLWSSGAPMEDVVH